jgi:hypothetical protein
LDFETMYLPDVLEVSGNMSFSGCGNIRYPPRGLKVGGDLYLTHSSIVALPEGVNVGGKVVLHRDNQFTDIPKGLEVRRVG